MKKLNDQDLFPVGVKKTLPGLIHETILTRLEISALLGDFILKFGTKKEVDLHNLPLLLTQDNQLRRFGTMPEVFPHKWHKILHWKPDHFISYGFLSSEKHLIEKNHLKELTAPTLIRHLKGYQKDLPVIEILKFILETFKDYKDGRQQTRLNYVKQFGDIPLIPVKRAGGLHFVLATDVKSVLQKKSECGWKAIHEVFTKAGADVLNIEVQGGKLKLKAENLKL